VPGACGQQRLREAFDQTFATINGSLDELEADEPTMAPKRE
jgi:hypothetical protein